MHIHTHTHMHMYTHTQGKDTLVAGWEVTNLVEQELGNNLKVLRVEFKPAGVDTQYISHILCVYFLSLFPCSFLCFWLALTVFCLW